MLAAISGETAVHQLIYIAIIGACLLLIWWLGKWLCGVLEAPAIALKGWNIIFVVLAVLALINFLLALIDKPFIRF